MVWIVFSWHTLGPLLKVEPSFNATGYLNIIANQVHLFMATVSVCKQIFAFKMMSHASRLVLSWNGSTNMTVFSLLQWPAKSPDLNLIEHLLDEMEQAIQSRDPLPANLTQPWEALESTWANTSVELFRHLVESMPQ